MPAKLRRAASIAALGLATWPCLAVASCSGTPMECGGQCKAPYELDVGFEPVTSVSAAKQAIH
jgi:hypothetical protein